MLLAVSASSDRKLGGSEVLVAQRNPVTEEGSFIRVRSVRSHQAEVRAAPVERPVYHFAAILKDKVAPGDDVQGTVRRAKAWQVIGHPSNLNELVRDGTDQHPAVEQFAERNGIAAGRLGVLDARRCAQRRDGAAGIRRAIRRKVRADIKEGAGVENEPIPGSGSRCEKSDAGSVRQVSCQS